MLFGSLSSTITERSPGQVQKCNATTVNLHDYTRTFHFRSLVKISVLAISARFHVKAKSSWYEGEVLFAANANVRIIASVITVGQRINFFRGSFIALSS